MKLIYIANIRLPTEKAHGIQIIEMCEAFAKIGHEVKLIVPQRFNKIKKDPFEYYGAEQNFEIKRLPCLDLIPLDKYIGHLGFWIESVTFYLFTLLHLFFKKADIIYTRDKLFLFYAFFKKNLIYEAHGFPQKYFFYHLFFKRLKGIVVITQKLKNLFVKQKISSDKILVAPSGVDLEKFNIEDTQEECRRRLNLPLGKKIVLYTGHLYKWKGVQVLAESSQFLPEDVEIYFVGGTEEHIKKFKIYCSQLNVHIMGHKPHDEIPYWLKAADVLIFPSSDKDKREKYWTSPLKIFEYMASKRIIVSSDLPSIREILNENNAFLVKSDNPEKLAEGIKNALKNLNFSAKTLNQAFQDVQSYTWQKRTENILNFLQ